MSVDRDRLIELRREFHRHPEPAWREFWTTARIVEELETIGVDELHVGREALAGERLAVPDDDELEPWMQRAREAGADPDVLGALSGGWTGAVAVLERGEGPTVGLRVDIDGLPREEATDDEHHPAREGFRSETGAMHACGHDAHITIGLGVIEAIKRSDFSGTLKIFFQPAEETIGGGRPMAESGHLDDVGYLFALHIGLDYPTGEIVCGIDDFLAVTQFYTTFEGEPGHAGARPEAGRNAVQAMVTAVSNLYGIERHSEGPSRINAGRVGGGTATNIIPEEAFIHGEARGATTAIRDHVFERAGAVFEGAAISHDCEFDVTVEGEAPSAESDAELVEIIREAARSHPDVERATRRGEIGGSEDATFLMQRVQNNGGLATYLAVGTDHPGGHHTATFDVDEESLGLAVDVVSDAVERVAVSQP
ncbi:amidohydrolase [Natronomonas sp. F2-12]|uniref:Amidohydrolase n=1 Tax=Natronomonas aquatica TaxID=2841590 RepID=A0A9R1CP47_9EURY|nr:amidohydrolase [Natronomonas aquatica]MCQ4332419.1 amidohydrolase [Natronomonas aquatica]